jgi:hypothetical protein
VEVDERDLLIDDTFVELLIRRVLLDLERAPPGRLRALT